MKIKKISSILCLGALLTVSGCVNKEESKEELATYESCDSITKNSDTVSTFSKSFSNVYFRGTPNNFGNTEMQLIANNLWSTTVSFGSKNNERFKFDIYGNWSLNFGDNNRDGISDRNGSDIKGVIGKKCNITFNDVSKKYTVTETEQVYDKVYLRGTFNNWEALEMNYIGNSCWQTDVQFGKTNNERFKFDILKNWDINFGDNNRDGIGERNGKDIPVLSGKKYSIIFNAKLNSYTLKEIKSKVVFSENFENGLEGWGEDSFINNYKITQEKNIGIDKSNCISIKSEILNDVTLWKKLNLTAGKIYKMSAYIKGENLVYGESKCIGVNICLKNVFYQNAQYSCKEINYDWKKVEMFFVAPKMQEAIIGLRLGFTRNTISGKAYFDNVIVEEVDENSGAVIKSGENVGIIFDKEDTTTITETKLSNWVSNLNLVYNSYFELVGKKPFDGDKTYILPTNFEYGAIAGNPILTSKSSIKENLKKTNDLDDWGFGYLHEIGHNFDCDGKWNFDGEFFANFKMVYVLEKLNGIVWMNNISYKGKEIYNYYKYDSSESYNNTPVGVYKGDWLTAKFIEIEEITGWEVFKSVFREFNEMPDVPNNKVYKFNLFIKKLEENSGYKFRRCNVFTETDLETIYNEYNK